MPGRFIAFIDLYAFVFNFRSGFPAPLTNLFAAFVYIFVTVGGNVVKPFFVMTLITFAVTISDYRTKRLSRAIGCIHKMRPVEAFSAAGLPPMLIIIERSAVPTLERNRYAPVLNNFVDNRPFKARTFFAVFPGYLPRLVFKNFADIFRLLVEFKGFDLAVVADSPVEFKFVPFDFVFPFFRTTRKRLSRYYVPSAKLYDISFYNRNLFCRFQRFRQP